MFNVSGKHKQYVMRITNN